MVRESFYNIADMNRLLVGLFGALCIHYAVFVFSDMPLQRAVIPSETYSAPTNVSVRFIAERIEPKKVVEPVVEPVEVKTPPKPEPVVEKNIVKKVVPKPVKKITAKKLNKIKPAAALTEPKPAPVKPVQNQPVQVKKTVQDVVPVTRDVKTFGRRVQPEYPRSALRRRQEGTVLLRVLISETGKREDIKIHSPSRYSLLNNAAVKAVKKWKFKPHLVNGRPVKSWIEIPIEFKIR